MRTRVSSLVSLYRLSSIFFSLFFANLSPGDAVARRENETRRKQERSKSSARGQGQGKGKAAAAVRTYIFFFFLLLSRIKLAPGATPAQEGEREMPVMTRLAASISQFLYRFIPHSLSLSLSSVDVRGDRETEIHHLPAPLVASTLMHS